MKRWIAILIVIAALGVGGYKFGMNYISDKMIDQVLAKTDAEKLLQDPEIQQEIQNQLDAQEWQQLAEQGLTAGEPGGMNANSAADAQPQQGQLSFSSKEEALSFLLTKFSMSELARFAATAQGGAAEERQAIQAEMMSRLTAEEIQALKAIGLHELSKRQP